MARSSVNIEEMLTDAIAEAVRKVVPALQQCIVDAAAAELEKGLSLGATSSAPRATRRARPRGEEMTQWVADRNARRVPKFVIDATGLDTKKKIIARFGEDAAFEKGKPLPKPVK